MPVSSFEQLETDPGESVYRLFFGDFTVLPLIFAIGYGWVWKFGALEVLCLDVLGFGIIQELMLRGAEQSGRRNAQVLVPKFLFLAEAERQEQQGDSHGGYGGCETT